MVAFAVPRLALRGMEDLNMARLPRCSRCHLRFEVRCQMATVTEGMGCSGTGPALAVVVAESFGSTLELPW